MIYAVETASGGTINTPSFTKIGSVVQKLLGNHTHIDRGTHTYTQQGDPISLLLSLLSLF
jgi:hypothetical protein